MGSALRTAAASDAGRHRTNNEDAVLVTGSLLAVADGMGGHEGGEVASAIAIATLRDLGPDADPAALAPALERANQAIRDAAPGRDGMSGMGTTCTAAVVRDGIAHIAHIGDSRAYLFRAGELRQLTEDHALLAQMVRAGLMTEEQASHDERRNVILRALGAAERADIDTLEIPLRSGDRLLLCSDGLHSVVDDEGLCSALGAPEDLDAVAADLIARANRAGGPDNISVVLLEYTNGSATGDLQAAPDARRGAPGRRLLAIVLSATIIVVIIVLVARPPDARPVTPGPAATAATSASPSTQAASPPSDSGRPTTVGVSPPATAVPGAVPGAVSSPALEPRPAPVEPVESATASPSG